jgi:hypothetical protein
VSTPCGRITTRQPTVGACWDADRLNLLRVGMTPDARFMSTAEGRRPERIEWARRRRVFHLKRSRSLSSGLDPTSLLT